MIYKLCGNNGYKNKMFSGFSEQQKQEEFVDLTIAADGCIVKVHRNIIALSSPYLREILKSMPNHSPVLFLNNVSHKILSYLLEYIYQGEVDIPADSISEFIVVSKSLHIAGVADIQLPQKPQLKVTILENQVITANEGETPNKRMRCTNNQKSRLIAHMAQHKEMSFGSTSAIGNEILDKAWQQLATDLAEVGPAKSVAQWKITWRDIQHRARSQRTLTEARRVRRQSNEPIKTPVLSETDKILLSSIAKHKETIDVPESTKEIKREETPSLCLTNAAGQIDPLGVVESKAPRIYQPLKAYDDRFRNTFTLPE